MSKRVKTVVSALVAAGAIAMAVPAMAHDRDWGGDRYERGDRYDRGDRGRHWDRDHDGWGRHDRWDRRVSVRYYGGRYGYDGYRGPWRVGGYYPYWRNSGYVINYRDYDLPPPRHGYRYYRDRNGDVVMAAVAGGMIGLIIGGALH